MTRAGIGLSRRESSGKVSGDHIDGTVQVVLPEGSCLEPWHSSRTATLGYFAPTGINMQ